MKIGVVSDTHSYPIPEKVIKDLKNMDLIIHTGDFCSLEVLKSFSKYTKVEAVCGNMDEEKVVQQLPVKKIIELEGYHIGIIHGQGPAKKVIDYVKKEFQEDKVDAVIFGHSHSPFNEEIDGRLYFNPGSATDTVFAPYRSYGVLEISKYKIKGRIIPIDE